MSDLNARTVWPISPWPPRGSSLRDVQMSRAERDFRLQVIAEWRVSCIERNIADNPTPVPPYVGARRAR